MPLPSFDEQLKKDVSDVFLNGDFTQEAIYGKGTNYTKISVQLFEEPLDRLNTTYYLAWTKHEGLPYVDKGDTLEVSGVKYSIVDFTPDEHKSGVNLFLQEV